MSRDRDVARAASVWNMQFRNDAYFWSLNCVLRHMNQRISGDPNSDWIDWVCREHLADRLPLQRCLSLCCGRGHLERRLVQGGVAIECDGMDVSDQSVEEAQKVAAKLGLDSLRYVCADVNQMHLETDVYDAVFVQSGLHHIARLEHVYEQVYRGLKPGGWFVMNEYVGPSRFQFSDRQLEVMNAALRLLPREYRKSIRHQQTIRGDGFGEREMPGSARAALVRVFEKARSRTLWGAVRRRLRAAIRARRGQDLTKERIDRPTVAEMKLWDPSEAVRSAEILPLLPTYFQVVETRFWGGTILNFLLDDIAGNFDDSEEDAKVLQMLFCIEDTLIDVSELDSDFAVIVARKGEVQPGKTSCNRGDSL